MKNMRISLLAFLLIVALSPFFLTCAPSGGDATVNIDLGFAHDEASNRSVIDSILNLIATKAYAQPPANIEQIVVRVEGPGMPTTEYFFAPDVTTATVVVPAGSSRIFTVIATVVPGDPSSALSFRGTETVDLAPGETVNLSVLMIVSETKLVFPNPDTQGGDPRIIQLDTLNDASIEELRIAQVNPTNEPISTFRPWDVDFDARGRIYIANNYSTTDTGVIRVDKFTTTNPIKVARYGTAGVSSITIDRANNLLYHSIGSELRRTDLSTATFPDAGTAVDLSAISGIAIFALSCDNAGMLYIADGQSGSHKVVKLNPNTGDILGTYTSDINFDLNVSGPTYTYAALMIRSNYLYVANFGGIDNRIILQLTSNLQFVKGYGIRYITTPDTAKGHFYGPHFFIGIRNDRIYIMDEIGDGGSAYDKLVAMDDMSGTNWDYNDSFSFFFDC